MIIYKITNKINGKIYIGITTVTLEQRWKQHIQYGKTCDRHLYNSMRKYGIENFTIEEIDNTDNFKELGELERYYIKLYNSQDSLLGYNITAGGESNQLDGNPRAKLKVEDVVQIREIYSYGELRCKECWKLFEDRISYSAFQKIWEGVTWQSIMPEIYTPENKLHHSNQKSNPGCLNGNAIYTDEEVITIRKYYVEHTLSKTHTLFGGRSKSKDSFRGLIANSYKHLPIYSKTKQVWLLQGQPIDINNYNPVSTIPGTRE